jgi:hypothetical protein
MRTSPTGCSATSGSTRRSSSTSGSRRSSSTRMPSTCR